MGTVCSEKCCARQAWHEDSVTRANAHNRNRQNTLITHVRSNTEACCSWGRGGLLPLSMHISCTNNQRKSPGNRCIYWNPCSNSELMPRKQVPVIINNGGSYVSWNSHLHLSRVSLIQPKIQNNQQQHQISFNYTQISCHNVTWNALSSCPKSESSLVMNASPLLLPGRCPLWLLSLPCRCSRPAFSESRRPPLWSPPDEPCSHSY